MISALALSVVLGLLGFIPLLGGPRYEAALVAGLIAPAWTGVHVALVVERGLRRVSEEIGSEGAFRFGDGAPLSLKSAGIHIFAVLSVATLHGLLGGFCEPGPGYALLLLGPCMGILLMTQWARTGTWLLFSFSLGRLSRAWALLLIGSAPVGIALFSALIRGWHFYSSPTVFAYDSFVGYFSGPIYDTIEYDLSRLLSFRVGSMCTIGALFVLNAYLTVRVSGGRAWPSFSGFVLRPGGRWAGAAVAALALLSAGHTSASDELGHTQTADSIRRALGRELSVGPCRVSFSSGVDRTTAERLGRECSGHLQALSRYFDKPIPERVNVFLFASSSEKRYFMGAATTYIAKPWRREIYLQPGGFPHPVLGHELAHVFTGQFGQGPFQVAGLLWGLIPDPGRVEGFAVAAAPSEQSEGTLDEWTSAMRAIDLLPPLKSLFRLGFFGTSQARSYSAAGSFVDFIREQHGSQTLVRWYRGEPLPQLTGQSWLEMEGGWHKHLDAITVPPTVLALSKPRFSRPGVFQRRCPHAVDRAVGGAKKSCETNVSRAEELTRRAVELDPLRTDLELMLPRCLHAQGATDEALVGLRKGVARQDRYSEEARRGALDYIGDIHLQRGELSEARASYALALKGTFARDARRQIEVKLWSLDQPAPIRHALTKLLAPDPKTPADPSLVLGDWFARGTYRSLAAYLISRRALAQGHFDEAKKYSNQVQVWELPLASLQKEALRGRMLLACDSVMSGEPDRLTGALDEYRLEGLNPAEEFEAGRLQERCRDGLRTEGSSTNLSP